MRVCNRSSVAPIVWVAPAVPAPASPPALAPGRLAPALPPAAAGEPASPIAVDAQAAAGKLVIARGEWDQETVPYRELEISGPRLASVMVAGPGSPEAADGAGRHSAAVAGEALAAVAAAFAVAAAAAFGVVAAVAAVGAVRTSS
jgi:hypothetical protein